MVERNVIVARPDDASFVVAPNNVPTPVTENVRVFVAVVTGLLVMSQILDVINDVNEPSQHIFVGSAVFMSFVPIPQIPEVTLIIPCVKASEVVVMVAVPGVVVACNTTVAQPLIADCVV